MINFISLPERFTAYQTMKILIAVDSYKGSLTSVEAGQAIQKGLKEASSILETEIIPIADGGEGMLTVMLNTLGGEIQRKIVHNPCMKPISAEYGISYNNKTAFIEMANASGLTLIEEHQRNPMKTTTYGTGELICDALDKGCEQIIIGIGGSATNDAGIGILQALGFKFTDKNGYTLGVGGEILSKIAKINIENKHPLLEKAHFIVACDVNNPFCGTNGAAYAYAQQKGADKQMIKDLDDGMRSFAKIIRETTGKDIRHIPGSGAAGGAGGGLLAFLNTELKSGAELLLKFSHFEEKAQNASLIITGEGKIDKQTLAGKIPYHILQIGKKKEIPVIAIAGKVENRDLLLKAGFTDIYSITPKGMTIKEAMKPDTAINNLQKTSFKLASAYLKTLI